MRVATHQLQIHSESYVRTRHIFELHVEQTKKKTVVYEDVLSSSIQFKHSKSISSPYLNIEIIIVLLFCCRMSYPATLISIRQDISVQSHNSSLFNPHPYIVYSDLLGEFFVLHL